LSHYAFILLTVQHTGTYFTGRTLCELTGFCSPNWKPWDGSKGQIRFTHSHLYHKKRPQPSFLGFWSKWVDGSDLPIITSIRHPQRSFGTLEYRTGHNNYSWDDHFAAYNQMISCLDRERFHGFRVDCEDSERLQELTVLADFLLEFGLEQEIHNRMMEKIPDWAMNWPKVNFRGSPPVGIEGLEDLVGALEYEMIDI